MNKFIELIQDIRACKLCDAELPLGPNPVFQAHPDARLLIAGQAPGKKVHETSVPFDDPSGDRLRIWMGVKKETFYDHEQIAILPMGFCYPGKGKGGDLPPRPECAVAWREALMSYMPRIHLVLVIGQYAQEYYFGTKRKGTLTETVKAWKEYGPKFMPLPHPSPRNNIWLRKNHWFEDEVVPTLQKSIAKILSQ